MPAGQPFTALCQSTARPRSSGRADLHTHTTCSDGIYTPSQIVELARRSGLAAVAITDHDTLAGVAEAQRTAQGSGVEIISGVEITADFQGREFHLLGYFCRVDDPLLNVALERLRQQRTHRFHNMVDRLRRRGVPIDDADLPTEHGPASLGRRHLAELLVQKRRVSSVREAFARYLHDRGEVNVPKSRLPVAEGISLIRGAGGVASWAHPFYDGTRQRLAELRRLGLQAIEVEYPTHRDSWKSQLRAWANELRLAITGGSDCHGPEPLGRVVGACGITVSELKHLRQLIP